MIFFKIFKKIMVIDKTKFTELKNSIHVQIPRFKIKYICIYYKNVCITSTSRPPPSRSREAEGAAGAAGAGGGPPMSIDSKSPIRDSCDTHTIGILSDTGYKQSR